MKDPAEIGLVAAVEEVAAVARTSPTLLRERVEMLTTYADEHPVLHRALLDGQITTGRARLIARETLRLPGARQRAWVQTAILPVAERLGEAALRTRIETLIAQADPQRYRDLLDADGGQVSDSDQVDEHEPAGPAGRNPVDTDPNDADPVGSDPAGRHSDSSQPGSGRVRVEPKVTLNVTIPFQVLQALWAGQPAPTAFGLIDVAGHGPIPAKALASLLVEYGARATWRCQILDDRPDSPTYASIIGVGRAAHDPGYTPSPALKALVQARTPHCAFPGCRRPAVHGDLDHVIPYAAGGPTADLNLTPLCRHHHLVKHHTGFGPTLDPLTGQVTWRTPSGHHVAEPPDTPPPLEADADLPDAWPEPPF